MPLAAPTPAPAPPAGHSSATDAQPPAAAQPAPVAETPVVPIAEARVRADVVPSIRPTMVTLTPTGGAVARDEIPALITETAPRRARSEPAFRAFAGAMFEAARDAAPMVVTPPAAMTPGHDRTPLDLTQTRWPHAMVDRIERLRDEASLSDTRIRLVPDALGAIDVTLRRDGETVYVAFRAEHAETGRLLAEARPELAALAEARGIKIAEAIPNQTSAPTPTAGWAGTQPGTGFGGGDRAPRQQPQPSHTPAAPPRRVHADDAPDGDTRIA